MAIIFYKNIRNVTASAILAVSTTTNTLSTGTFAVTVYSGLQPTAGDITSTWTNYNTNFLVHIPLVALYIPSVGVDNPTIMLQSSGSASAINSGTGTWAILWPTQPTQANVQASTIPSDRFLIANVSEITSNGIVKFTSTNFVSGNTYSVQDLTMVFGGGNV